MGGFIVVIAAVFIALLASFNATYLDMQKSNIGSTPTSIQAVAANLIEYHRAAVDFVSQTANRNPPSTTWTWTASNQASVRCSPYSSATYPTGSVGGTCTAPTTEFRPPVFFSILYNWSTYYKSDGAGGANDIVVTYVTSSSISLDGYTSQEVANALNDYALSSETSWYWGLTTAEASPRLSNGTTYLTMPTGFSTQSVVAIATVIP